MKDLVFFVCFILIFLFGFSISSWSFLITPRQIQWIYDRESALVNITISNNTSDTWGWKLIHDVANYGVWKVFGEVDPFGRLIFHRRERRDKFCLIASRNQQFVFSRSFSARNFIRHDIECSPAQRSRRALQVKPSRSNRFLSTAIASSVTVQNVRDQSHNLWRYQRFLLVNEFRNRSLLPPPFNILSTFYMLLQNVVERGRRCFRQHLPGKQR